MKRNSAALVIRCPCHSIVARSQSGTLNGLFYSYMILKHCKLSLGKIGSFSYADILNVFIQYQIVFTQLYNILKITLNHQ